jgi:hypothetical protein
MLEILLLRLSVLFLFSLVSFLQLIFINIPRELRESISKIATFGIEGGEEEEDSDSSKSSNEDDI